MTLAEKIVEMLDRGNYLQKLQLDEKLDLTETITEMIEEYEKEEAEQDAFTELGDDR